MDGDSFSDPRRRSSRSRGRSRGHGRGRGVPPVRGRPSATKAPQPLPADLDSNEYRFKEGAHGDYVVEDEEDEFEAGVDFDIAAAQSMADAPRTDVEGALDQFMVKDLSGLERALSEVPLWVLLGEGCRSALGVAEDDVLENYLDPFEEAAGEPVLEGSMGADLAEELAGLSFDDENDSVGRMCVVSGDAQSEKNGTGSPTKPAATDEVPGKTTPELEASKDDFDKWLDDV